MHSSANTDTNGVHKPRSATTPIALLNQASVLASSTECDLCAPQGPQAHNRNGLVPQADELTRCPDGGFGWWIVVASFICNVIVDGVIFSFGVLLLEISHGLNQTKGITAWVGSLQAGFYLIVGPFVSFLSNKYGCKLVTIIGSIISCLGFVLSYYAQDVFTLCLTFGVLGGIGYGFIYLPAIVMVANYFEEKRAFATGIAVCGSGIGGFVMAPITQIILKYLGWRKCFLVLAMVNLLCLFSALLFKPIEEYNRKRLAKQSHSDKPVQEPLLNASDTDQNTQHGSLRRCVKHLLNDPKLVADLNNNLAHESKRSKASSFLVSSRKGSLIHQGIHTPHCKSRRSSSHLSVSTINFAAAGAIAKSVDKLPNSLVHAGSVKNEPYQSATSVQQPSNQMFDFSLLSSQSFVLFSFSGFLTLSGFFIPFMYLADRAIQSGISAEAAALLLSVIGITNTLGRVFCGWISDWPNINALFINNAALIIGGLLTILCPIVCHTYTMLIVYSVIFGFSIACFAALRSVITIELLGLEKLTSAFGLLLLPQGIATIIGSPVAGWFYDVTGTYDASFYAAGAVILISGVICIPLPAIARWEKSRSQTKHNVSNEIKSTNI